MNSRRPRRHGALRLVGAGFGLLVGAGFGLLVGAGFGLLVGATAAYASGPSVVGTPHDLTPSAVAPNAASIDAVCVACHVPHGAAGAGPLWSYELPVRAYTVYTSTSLDARVDQPDGDSKLCLSCHDGTVAPLGVRGPAGGSSTIAGWHRPVGVARGAAVRGPDLGTDLSDDHPISFVYDAPLAARDGQLAPPERTPTPHGGTITSDLLDHDRKLQCTSCHDAHDNSRGQFLRLDAARGALCATCHTLRDYAWSAHQPDQSPRLDRACATCHVPHDASRGTALLAAPQVELCAGCHASEARDMRPGNATRHPLADGLAPPPGELTCATCHNPHVVRAAALYERAILTDPDDPLRPPALVPEADVPHDYRQDPIGAAKDTGAFCLDCHDGGWPGAVDVQSELVSPHLVRTRFAIGRRNLHAAHTALGRPEATQVGCTYCHDAHGGRGNLGVPRGALLYAWLDVREFPYRGKSSCATSDVAARCHSER